MYNDLRGRKKSSRHLISSPTLVNLITQSDSKLIPAMTSPQNYIIKLELFYLKLIDKFVFIYPDTVYMWLYDSFSS